LPARICIIAFKPVHSTIHVLKQIAYLSAADYDLTVIGHGEPDPAWQRVTWCAVPRSTFAQKAFMGISFALGRLFGILLFGRLWPRIYDFWFWHTARYQQAFAYALASGADAIHANDWHALPIAIEVARRTGARVVFHAHEFAPLEREDSIVWRLLVAPAIRSILRKYTAPTAVPIDASITVCAPIAERYHREYGLDPIVIYNAPKRPPEHSQALTVQAKGSATEAKLHLIHHGYAQRNRGLDKLIEALALAHVRFVLHFMLVPADKGFIDDLKALGDRIAPGRVMFHDPVAPDAIVDFVAQFDIGFCVIQPTNYNNLMMLPNKFFEYIMAGLAVCIGPSPAMVDIVQTYGVGCIAPTFDPPAVAVTLNALTAEQLFTMRQSAQQAREVLNADVEMGKLVTLYQRLLNSPDTIRNAAV